MARLHLIRHVAVELREDVPPGEWLPNAAGLEAAAALGREPWVRMLTVVATSPEPKAVTTAAPLAAAAGVPLRIDEGLREVRRERTAILPRGEYVDLVGRFLRGEAVAGWEDADAARARFAAALERLAHAEGGPLAAVTHGLVLALHLGWTVERWRRLRLPDVVELDV